MIDYSFKKPKVHYVLTGKSEKSELVFLYGQKQNRLSYTRVGFLSGFPIP